MLTAKRHAPSVAIFGLFDDQTIPRNDFVVKFIKKVKVAHALIRSSC